MKFRKVVSAISALAMSASLFGAFATVGEAAEVEYGTYATKETISAQFTSDTSGTAITTSDKDGNRFFINSKNAYIELNTEKDYIIKFKIKSNSGTGANVSLIDSEGNNLVTGNSINWDKEATVTATINNTDATVASTLNQTSDKSANVCDLETTASATVKYIRITHDVSSPATLFYFNPGLVIENPNTTSTVTFTETNGVEADITIYSEGTEVATTTTNSGIILNNGDYTYTAIATGYENYSGEISAIGGNISEKFTMNAREKYTGTVNAVLENDTIIKSYTNEAYIEDTLRIYYEKYIKYGEKYYEIAANNSTPYYAKEVADATPVNVVYNESSVDYVIEAGNMNLSGKIAANGEKPEYYSNGDAKRLSKYSYVYTDAITTSGKYTVTMYGRNRHNAAGLDLYLRNAETGALTDLGLSLSWSNLEIANKTATDVNIPEGYQLVLYNNKDFNSNIEMDYLTLTKTGELSEDTWVFEPIPLTEWSTSEIFFTYNTPADEDGIIGSATTTGIVFENFLTTYGGLTSDELTTMSGQGNVTFAIVVAENEPGYELTDVYLKQPQATAAFMSGEFEADAEIDESEYLELDDDMSFDIE